MKIHITEDDPLIHQYLKKKLLSKWYEVTEWQADLYLFDLGINNEPQWESLQELRKSTTGKILILSWYPKASHEGKALELWADWYIEKPVIPSDLIDKIREYDI